MSKVKSKSNKLTTSKLNQLNKNLDERKTIYVGKDKYEIQIDKSLRKSKIQLLLSQYLVHLEQLKRTELDTDAIRDAALLETALFLENFTDLPKQEDVVKKVQQVLILADLDILDEIVNAFDSEEVARYKEITQKVFENVKQYGESMGDLMLKDYFANGGEIEFEVVDGAVEENEGEVNE